MLNGGNEKTDMTGQTRVGEYLVEKVFRPGKKYHWEEMIRKATGEPLNPRYFVDQYLTV